MWPNRPLPTLPFANLPLRRNPNDAAAIIAAKVTRGHFTSVVQGLSCVRFAVRQCVISAQVNSGVREDACQWGGNVACVQSNQETFQAGPGVKNMPVRA
jgi:hypothetical protein